MFCLLLIQQVYIITDHCLWSCLESLCNYIDIGGVKVRLSQKVYRVIESDGFAVIKLLVSGYRRFSMRVAARAFKPTKFDLPAGLTHKCLGIQLSSAFCSGWQ